MRINKLRRPRAQSIIETVVGIIFLIPIVLLLFDVGVLVLTNTANDKLAKEAARAAASVVGKTNAPPGDPSFHNNALAAATAVVSRYNNNAGKGFLKSVAVQYFAYHDAGMNYTSGGMPANGVPDPGLGNVQVYSRMTVVCPVAFPGFDGLKTFEARAVEPIVSQPP